MADLDLTQISQTGTNFKPLLGITSGSLFSSLMNLMFILSGVAFFFYLITAGIRWILSGGDKEAVANAGHQIRNALIGLTIVFSIFAIGGILNRVFGIDLFSLCIPGPNTPATFKCPHSGIGIGGTGTSTISSSFTGNANCPCYGGGCADLNVQANGGNGQCFTCTEGGWHDDQTNACSGVVITCGSCPNVAGNTLITTPIPTPESSTPCTGTETNPHYEWDPASNSRIIVASCGENISTPPPVPTSAPPASFPPGCVANGLDCSFGTTCCGECSNFVNGTCQEASRLLSTLYKDGATIPCSTSIPELYGISNSAPNPLACVNGIKGLYASQRISGDPYLRLYNPQLPNVGWTCNAIDRFTGASYPNVCHKNSIPTSWGTGNISSNVTGAPATADVIINFYECSAPKIFSCSNGTCGCVLIPTPTPSPVLNARTNIDTTAKSCVQLCGNQNKGCLGIDPDPSLPYSGFSNTYIGYDKFSFACSSYSASCSTQIGYIGGQLCKAGVTQAQPAGTTNAHIADWTYCYCGGVYVPPTPTPTPTLGMFAGGNSVIIGYPYGSNSAICTVTDDPSTPSETCNTNACYLQCTPGFTSASTIGSCTGYSVFGKFYCLNSTIVPPSMNLVSSGCNGLGEGHASFDVPSGLTTIGTTTHNTLYEMERCQFQNDGSCNYSSLGASYFSTWTSNNLSQGAYQYRYRYLAHDVSNGSDTPISGYSAPISITIPSCPMSTPPPWFTSTGVNCVQNNSTPDYLQLYINTNCPGTPNYYISGSGFCAPTNTGNCYYWGNLDSTLVSFSSAKYSTNPCQSYSPPYEVSGTATSLTQCQWRPDLLPTPTTIPNIVLNSASGDNCNTVCGNLSPAKNCVSVGTNTTADNHYRWEGFNNACRHFYIGPGSGFTECDTAMSNGTWTVPLCNNIAPNWTYCNCQ